MRSDRAGKAILQNAILCLLHTNYCVSLNIKTNASKEPELQLRSELQGTWKQFGFVPQRGAWI